MSVNVRVRFINAANGEQLFISEMPVESLPARFDTATTLQIEEEDWEVVRAEPALAEEFIKTGQLTLTIRKVEITRLNPADILMTLPTISDDIGEVVAGSDSSGQDAFFMEEDDWRQVELVSYQYQPLIESELEQIYRIFQEESVENDGFLLFRNLHVRKELPTPLGDQPLTLDQLYNAFPTPLHHYAGLAYYSGAGLVKEGFAFRLEEVLNFYGLATPAAVKILGLRPHPSNQPLSAQSIAALAAFLTTYELSLVDWPHMTQVGGTVDELTAYFQEQE